jgi:cytochrome c oxidase accessory protein FixG
MDFVYPEETFRDKPSNIDGENKRAWLFPKKPAGKWTNYRRVVAFTLLSLFLVIPFIKIGGNPLFMFNLIDRQFFIFGQIFWPQDFPIFLLFALIFFVFVILFTSIFGRVWCGWTCPQTILMEMVFRPIEYFIEGDYKQQRRLAESEWNAEKIRKRSLKQLVFILISLVMSHASMAYLVGIDRVKELVSTSPLENMTGFLGLLLFTLLFYLVFTRVREIACTIICPYGRLQSVLLTKNSAVVAYDYVRGEPRGKINKQAGEMPKGDCIDCKLCVHVCPTGIDIRNGTQMECVNCTACIDACNEVMDKVGKPRGLIRIDSLFGIENKIPFRFTARVAMYSLLLVGLLGMFGFLLVRRTMIEAKVMRVPGTLFQRTEVGIIGNMYNIQAINKTNLPQDIEVIVDHPDAKIRFVAEELSLKPQASSSTVFFVEIPENKLEGMKTDLEFTLMVGGKEIQSIKTKFIGPSKGTK